MLDNGFGVDMLAAFDMLDQFGPMLQQLIETARPSSWSNCEAKAAWETWEGAGN